MAKDEYAYQLKRRLGHPVTPPKGTPVRPRDAASLILVRRGADGPEVLMGKRHRKAAFIPDAYVFPGGGVDASDGRAYPATAARLAPHRTQLAVNNSQPRARAIAMTAVRETFEETGLILGRAGDPYVPTATESDEDVKGDSHLGSAMKTMGLAPDLACLTLPRPGDHLAPQPDPFPRPVFRGGCRARERRPGRQRRAVRPALGIPDGRTQTADRRCDRVHAGGGWPPC